MKGWYRNSILIDDESNVIKGEKKMFFNPFPMWFIILVIIPFRLLNVITYLPYYLFKLIRLGKWYKNLHYIIWANIEQFILQPKNYIKKAKKIYKQIVEESKEISNL